MPDCSQEQALYFASIAEVALCEAGIAMRQNLIAGYNAQLALLQANVAIAQGQLTQLQADLPGLVAARDAALAAYNQCLNQ